MKTGEPIKNFFIKVNEERYGFSYYETSKTITWNNYHGEFPVAMSTKDPLWSGAGAMYKLACEKVWKYLEGKSTPAIPPAFLPGPSGQF